MDVISDREMEMKIVYTPQRNDAVVEYRFAGEAVTAVIADQSETFDFTGMPDGRAESITADTLPICPVLSAERANGDLTVKLLYWYGADAEDWEKEEREETV